MGRKTMKKNAHSRQFCAKIFFLEGKTKGISFLQNETVLSLRPENPTGVLHNDSCRNIYDYELQFTERKKRYRIRRTQ